MSKKPEYIIIIPNREILDIPIYSSKLKSCDTHFMKVLEFSKKYNLGIEYRNLSPEMILASLGHALICLAYEEMTATVYLPEYLSLEQIEILNKTRIKKMLKYFDTRGNFDYCVIDSDVKFQESCGFGYDEMYKYINRDLEKENVKGMI